MQHAPEYKICKYLPTYLPTYLGYLGGGGQRLKFSPLAWLTVRLSVAAIFVFSSSKKRQKKLSAFKQYCKNVTNLILITH